MEEENGRRFVESGIMLCLKWSGIDYLQNFEKLNISRSQDLLNDKPFRERICLHEFAVHNPMNITNSHDLVSARFHLPNNIRRCSTRKYNHNISLLQFFWAEA